MDMHLGCEDCKKEEEESLERPSITIIASIPLTAYGTDSFDIWLKPVSLINRH